MKFLCPVFSYSDIELDNDSRQFIDGCEDSENWNGL